MVAVEQASQPAQRGHLVRVAPHLLFNYVTVAGNVAPVGAGILDQGGTSQAGGGTLSNSVVAGNHKASGGEQDCGYTGSPAAFPLSSLGGNVIGDSSCHLLAATDRAGSAE